MRADFSHLSGPEPEIPEPTRPVRAARLNAALLFSNNDQVDAKKVGRSEGSLSRLRNGKEDATAEWYTTAGPALQHDPAWLRGFDYVFQDKAKYGVCPHVRRLMLLPKKKITAILCLDDHIPTDITITPVWLHPFLLATTLNPVFVAWYNEIENQTMAVHARSAVSPIGFRYDPPAWFERFTRKSGPAKPDEIYKGYR